MNWRATLRSWWLARHPRSDSWTLTQHNIYIVPTKAGLLFTLTLLVMLVTAINYQLNLGYVLTFLLSGAGLASMHMTHATLRALTLRLRTPQPGFAGEPVLLEVVLTNPGAPRYGIGLAIEQPGQAVRVAWVDVPALGQASAQLSFVPPRRGRCEVPALRAQTRFPLGLFRAWTVWRPASTVLAYPAPEQPVAALPATQPVGGADAPTARASDSGEMEGVRAYQRGDAWRRLAWKKVARSGELVSRDTRSSAQRELWLDWQAAQGSGVEARLSRLTAWVLAADRAGLAHGLRLPGVELAPGQGAGHRRQVLEALALWTP